MAGYISLQDLATQLGVSEEKIQQLRESGKLRAFRDGSSWKFKDDEMEKARTLLGEEGGGDQDFELTAGNDEEGSSGSMDSLLIEEAGDDANSSKIISDIEEGDSSLSLADSDIGLGDGLSSSSVDPASDTNASALSLGEGSDILEGSSINKPIDAAAEDSFTLTDDGSGLQLTDEEDGSDASIDLGDEPRDPEGTGSEVSLLGLGEDSLDLGTSGIGLDHDSSGELTLDVDDDEDSSMDLQLSGNSELGLADEPEADGSGISMVEEDSSRDLAAESSGLGLADDDDDDIGLADDANASGVALSTEGSGLELIADDPGASGISAAEDDDLLAPAEAGGDDGFLLTPVDGEQEGDDSGSQVIALDSESMSSESSLFGSGGLDDGDFSALDEEPGEGLEADDTMLGATSSLAAASATGGAVAYDPPYSFMNVLSLGITVLVMVVAGLMTTDMIWNLWSFNEPYSLNSTVMDGILSLLES